MKTLMVILLSWLAALALSQQQQQQHFKQVWSLGGPDQLEEAAEEEAATAPSSSTGDGATLRALLARADYLRWLSSRKQQAEVAAEAEARTEAAAAAAAAEARSAGERPSRSQEQRIGHKSLRNVQPVFMRLPPRFGKRTCGAGGWPPLQVGGGTGAEV